MLTHKGTETIEAPRLTLRRAVMEDARPMYDNGASDPEVTKFLTWPSHDGVDITKMVLMDWVDAYAAKDCYQWQAVGKP